MRCMNGMNDERMNGSFTVTYYFSNPRAAGTGGNRREAKPKGGDRRRRSGAGSEEE